MAVKMLTAYQTALTDRGYFTEMAILERLSTANRVHFGFQHVTPLLHHFEVESDKGRHLCLCTEVLGSNLQELRGDQPNRRFSLPTTKRIVKQILSALNYLHTECGIIHTGKSSNERETQLPNSHADLKPDNIMMTIDQQASVIEKLLEDDPSRLYPPRIDARVSPHPVITVVSQPVPNFGLQGDCTNLHIKLSDFGSGEWGCRLLILQIRD